MINVTGALLNMDLHAHERVHTYKCKKHYTLLCFFFSSYGTVG